MARYFSEIAVNNAKEVLEQVSAVGKVRREGGRKKPRYETATMSVIHVPARELPNFDYSDPNPSEAKLMKELNVNVHDVAHARIDPEENRLLSGAGGIYQMGRNSAERVDTLQNRLETKQAQRLNSDYERSQLHAATSVKNRLVEGFAEKRHTLNEDTPTELFSGKPQKTTVTYANVHPNLRSTVPVMGAYLHRKYGHLTASEDLSQYSSALVQHAQRRGLPVSAHPENEDADVTNDMYFDPDSEVTLRRRPPEGKTIPQTEITASKQHLRSLLRPQSAFRTQKEAKHMGPQFTQPQLPGMEG